MYTRSKGCELRNKTVGMCFLPPQLPGCVTWNKLHNFPGLQVVHLKQGIMVVLAYWYDVKIAQLCPTLCNPMDYTVHGILWSRILEWVAFPFSRGSFQPRDWTQVSSIAGGFFTSWAIREALGCGSWIIKKTECWRINAFECFWCWRRSLRVPWTARR